MPKRVIDFDAMWGSDKLAACAVWARREYAWLYGLADCAGCFELTNLRVIWGRVAAIRPDLSLKRLEQIFAEFHRCGLLFLWEQNGKRYGHWTGSDVPGRLPPPSWRIRLERLAPPVPDDRLHEYLSRYPQSSLKPYLEAAQAQGLGLVKDMDREREVVEDNGLNPTAAPPRRALALAFEGKHLQITVEEHRQLQRVYQGLTVAAHYAEMELWLDAHPERRRRNSYAFARNWLAREIHAPMDSGQARRGGRDERSDEVRRELRAGAGPQLAGLARVKREVLERVASVAAKKAV